MSVLWIEIRRSPARYSAVLVAITCWAVYWSLRTKDLSVWTEADVSSGYAFVLVGPAVAATGAWVAGRDRRIQWEELVSAGARSRDERAFLAFVSSAVLLVAGYLAGLLAIYADTARGATWGGPSLLLAAGNVAYLAVLLGVGVLLGTLVSWRIAPLALAIVVYWAQFWLTLSERTSRLVPIDDDVRFGAAPSTGLTLGRAGLWVLLAVGVAGLVVVMCRPGRRRLWGLVPAAAVLGALVVAPAHIAAAMPATTVRAELACSATEVEVCVHPAFSRIGDDVARRLDATLAPLSRAGVGPVRAEQVFGRGRLEDGVLSFHLARADNRFLGVGLDISADMAVARMLYGDGPCEGSRARSSSVARGGLLTYLTGYGEGDARSDRFSRSLARMSERERTAWLRANWSRALDCTVPRTAIV